MPEFFTVDRNGSCAPGSVIKLIPPHYNFAHLHNKNLETSDEIAQTISALFPDGVSPHGHRYLFERHNYVQNMAIPVSPAIELISELVRRAEFPNRPSRFTSLFGTETLEVAQTFRSKNGQPHHRIFRVSCENSFRADMCLLSLGASNASSLNLARKFWRGEGSQNPHWECLLVPPIAIIEQVEPVA